MKMTTAAKALPTVEDDQHKSTRTLTDTDQDETTGTGDRDEEPSIRSVDDMSISMVKALEDRSRRARTELNNNSSQGHAHSDRLNEAAPTEKKLLALERIASGAEEQQVGAIAVPATKGGEKTLVVGKGVGATKVKGGRVAKDPEKAAMEAEENYFVDLMEAAIDVGVGVAPPVPQGQGEDQESPVPVEELVETNLERSGQNPSPLVIPRPGAYSNRPGEEETRNEAVNFGSITPASPSPNPLPEHTGLAEAQPVNDDLEAAQEAEPVHPQPRSPQAKASPVKAAAFVGALAVIIVVFVVIVLVSQKQGGDDNISMVPVTDSPTPGPSPLTLEERVMSLLPDYTRADIERDTNSPQAMAYAWLMADPNLERYLSDDTTHRVIQRLALAAFFYSTNGPTTWVHSTNWLSYDAHECSWFMSPAFYEAYFHMTFHSPCLLEPDPSNPDEMGDVYRYFHLEGNGLQGSVPEEMWLLTKLRDFNVIVNNGLTGTISRRVSQLTKLETLAFAQSPITGTIPTEIALHHATFENLYLMNNRLVGTVPSELGLLTNMIEFDAADNLLTGTLPTELGNLHAKLEIFYFEGQSLTGTIATEFGRLTAVREFGLSNNHFEGTLPSEMGNLGRAHLFGTNGNQLHSTIPTEIGRLTSLIQMDLSNNHHTGTIPTELGQLAALPVIPDFDSYHFDPPKPTGRLIYLRMGGNILNSTLPTEIGRLTHLEILEVQETMLTGTVPTEFAVLSNLTSFNITGSLVSGTIPDELCSSNDTVIFECLEDSLLCGCDCMCNGSFLV